MSDRRTVSVSEFLQLVNETLRLIPTQEFCVEGEVSDFRIAQDKWVSFDLKDEQDEAVLKCFMTTWQLKTPVENGMRVQAIGYPKVYERYGQFKMNVQELSLVGEGALQRAYLLMKKKLEDEGLFETARKRALPRFPEKIGLITSKDAAAYGDFLRVLFNRWGSVRVMHANVHVQGREAVPDIVSAFSAFSALSSTERPDVIVLTRGGGGLEDLHAFNDEQVARAVFGSKIPVICGVGHERDESLCDFVADVRASTPSNAAERVVPRREEIQYEMDSMRRFIEARVEESIGRYRLEIGRSVQNMSALFSRHQERFFYLERQFRERAQQWIPQIREQLNQCVRVLRQLDPTRVLARGYSIVRIGDEVVRHVGRLEIGQTVHVQLAAGTFDADVKRIEGRGQQQLM